MNIAFTMRSVGGGREEFIFFFAQSKEYIVVTLKHGEKGVQIKRSTSGIVFTDRESSKYVRVYK